MNLKDYQDIEYQKFTSKLCRSKYPILGVRLPTLRLLANQLTLNDFSVFYYFEDYMLYAFVLGNEKNIDNVFNGLDFIVPTIDNWSICDSLVSSLKITKKYKEEMLKYILKYQYKSTFEKRFLIVMLLRYYVKNDIERTLEIIHDIETGEYYVDMAIAWLLSEAMIYHPTTVINYLQKEQNCFIVNKTISKARESYRISNKLKEELLKYKK